MCKKTVLTIVAVLMLAVAGGLVQAETVDVPNGEFLAYKPGTDYTVTAIIPSGSYTSGVGDNLAVKGNGIAEYSDGTTGGSVDCPGWIGLTGNNDLVNNGMDGSMGYNAFGTWSGGTGTTAQSADSLGDIVAGRIYTLSAMVNGSAGPLVLDLLADGVAITPTSSVTPSLPTDEWKEISRTYDLSALGEYVGQAMTIVLGTGAENLVGTRIVFDNVSLSYELLFQLEASDPIPVDEETDVSRDVVLSWTGGTFAATHDVYLDTSFGEVSNATTTSTAYKGRQAGASFAPDRLEFNTTYYWRIDEVNALPDSTIYQGNVWSFTTEPEAYPVDGQTITVTASSAAEEQGPENTINGSGLAGDLHSNAQEEMWLTASGGAEPAWIEYEFEKVLKLHEMWVWNSNGPLEAAVGFGGKDVTVEYSIDGVDYAALEGVSEFSRAFGQPNYAHNTTVDFAGVAAKYVRLTFNSNWGGILPQYGLSEVRFLYVPVRARMAEPTVGAVDVDVTTVLSWQAGRQAGAHDVYLSTNEQAVIDGTALVQTVTGTSYAPALDLGSTYYWRIDEVNDVEAPSVWQGDLWSFSTQEYLVVDDFESYTNYSPDRVFQRWIDGLGFSPDEFYPNGSNGNGSGSLVGYDPLAGDIMETTFIHSGNQAMPVAYDNTAATYSEATRTFVPAQDWSRHGITILTVWFHGDPGNDAQQMYVKINNTKVLYSGEASVVSEPRWRQWDISLEELATQGVNLQGVTQFALGFDRIGGVGGQGVMIFDDIRLQRPVASDVPSIAIAIPNGDFEEIYKPGSDTIAADLSDGWTQGVGLDVPMDSGTAIYSDGTTGDAVDIPGWIGADAQGWIDNGGSYDRDTAFPNRQGSVARQSATPDGLYYFLSNGGGWGNAAGGLIVSEAPVATVESGLTYTLSMLANGGATPVVLELLADGVALTPSSSVDPELSGEWQEFSRTYDAATLEAHVGESLTIRLGVGRGASGGQSHFDAVSLSYPEPTVSLVENFDSLAVGANMNEVDGWEGWFGDAQWGARVSDVVAYSGTNCLEIVGNRDDLVPNWPQQTSGQWTLTVMQYCPSNVAAAGKMYFGALSQYDAATETVGWIGSVIADFGTGKAYCEEDQAVQVDLAYDTWVELRVEIDLDSQMAHFYYNNVYLATRPASSVAGVDVWPTEEIETVYFDDFSFAPAQ